MDEIMAGHSKFKNIQFRKGAQDKKRAKLFARLGREITVAAKMGGAEPENNSKLRTAMQNAAGQNMPKDNIERAIKKSSEINNENYVEMRYEGFAPQGVAMIIEALTDNCNRTASNIRAILSKAGGMLGETGSASFMFSHSGCIFYDKNACSFEHIFEIAAECGANDVIKCDKFYQIFCNANELAEIATKIQNIIATNSNIQPAQIERIWLAKNNVKLEQQDLAKLNELIDNLEDQDDVQRVFVNIEEDNLTIKITN